MLTRGAVSALAKYRANGIVAITVLVTVVFTSCDSGMDVRDVDGNIGDDALVHAAKRYYEEYSEQDNMLVGKTGSDSIAAILADMVREYPPDWTQAVTWPDGKEFSRIATLIGVAKSATSFSHDSIAVVRTLVARAGTDGKIVDGHLVEFISADPIVQSDFPIYVKQWLERDFKDNKVIFAEYSLSYAHEQSSLYVPGENELRSVSIELKRMDTTGKIAAKVLVCYETGPIYRLDGIPVVTTTCVWRDDGGGDDDDGCPEDGCDPSGGDDDEDEEDEDSQCTEDQKAIAEEYMKDGWAESDWPCEIFVDADINGRRGTHDHLAGYLSPGFKSGRDAVESYMSITYQIGTDITSDWRCPTGNVNAGSTVPKSTHVQGRAGDFTASGFDEDMWDKFEEAAIAAGKTWNSPYGPDRSSGEYDEHIHIHW